MELVSKKILFFDHDPKMSGSSISLRYIIEEFKRQGAVVYLFTQKEKEFSKIFENIGVEILSIPGSKFKSFALSTHFGDDYEFLSLNWLLTFIKNVIRIIIGSFNSWKTIRNIKPDLVYLNEHNMFYIAIIAKALGVKTFIHLRSNFIKGKFGKSERLISKSIYRFNDFIFAITEVEAKQILKYNTDQLNKVIILPEFLSEDDFICNFNVNQLRQNFSLPIDKTIVISFIGIDRLKGTLEFLKAIDIVSQKNKNIYFVLAGEIKKTGAIKEVKKYYDECNKLLTMDSIKKNLSNRGYTNKQHELLFASDILVSPFKKSHFSRPIIEAWALKKPVITSDIPHSRSYVENEINGLFFKDSDDLAEKIIHLASDSTLREKLSINGYKKAKEKFIADVNLSVMIKKINLIFNYNV
jgi:glycosyltransferase involved in cell wall biosynthesis